LREEEVFRIVEKAEGFKSSGGGPLAIEDRGKKEGVGVGGE